MQVGYMRYYPSSSSSACVLTLSLQARDSTTPPEMKTMLYKLAARLISTAPSPSTDSADKFHLHLTILREVDLDEACKHLETPTAQLIYNNNLAVDELRRDIWAKKGMLKEEGDLARTRISENQYVFFFPSVVLD